MPPSKKKQQYQQIYSHQKKTLETVIQPFYIEKNKKQILDKDLQSSLDPIDWKAFQSS